MKQEVSISVVFDEDAIRDRIERLAGEIAATQPKDLLVVAILKGSYVFAADLLRAMHQHGMAPEVEFIELSSYREATVSSGQVRVVKDIESDVSGRRVMVLDDILESGRTLAFAKDLLVARGAAHVAICVMLEKPKKRAVQINADYVGFISPDYFLVGYGMDVAHRFRQLPFIGKVDD